MKNLTKCRIYHRYHVNKMRSWRSTTPPPTTGLPSSSPIITPVTLRQIWKVGSSIERIVRPGFTLTPDAVRDINRFFKGGISNTAGLVQTKRDLSRTKYAERTQKTRRALKYRPLQSGGVLSVAEGRNMVKQVEDQAVEKARRLV